MSLVYLFDLGNTTGKLWRLAEGVIEGKAVILHEGSMEKIIADLPPLFDSLPDEICGLAVVGRPAVQAFEHLCKDRWGVAPRFAQSQPGFSGIKSGYSHPEMLGVDRWLGLIGANFEGGSIGVVSCGTALTIDVLRQGTHEGGYILPGLALMGDSLCRHTAGVRFDAHIGERLGLGHNTSEAVLNGALLATVSVIERVAVEQEVSELVLTGGDASKVSAFLRIPHVVEPDLLLRGLRKYFER